MGQQNFKWNELSLGTCYYPEHWDKDLWESDLDRMLEADIRTIRIAEFAWSKVEPREGEFTFEFWDEFLELCNSKGMKVIFCTPTATPPAWLTEKYPDVLNCRIDGVPYRHGMRCQYNYNSAIWREKCAIIIEKTAEHYAKNPAIVGWQLGNEQNCTTNRFYSPADTIAFREFLKDKYGSLEELNRAWGNVFWNQEYTEWEQVFVPRLTIEGSSNPHMILDYYRFISDSAISFMKMQTDILRKYIKPGDFITTNGLFGTLDNHKLEKEALDVYTYDSYPDFGLELFPPSDNEQKLKDRWWVNNLTESRSICEHFGIMEQQSGANGWNFRMEAPAPKPGQLTLWAMQSIAHGADYISFFRWRTCTFGTEIYWHGILDYDNRNNRRYDEVKALGKRVAKLQELCGAKFVADLALVKSYDNNFDCDYDTWHGRIESESMKEIFAAAQLGHTPIDYLYMQEDTDISELMKYKVLIAPHYEILTEKEAELFTQYVQGGGTLIIGARTGLKDIDGHCVMKPMPGLLANICGASVKDFTFVGPHDEEVKISLPDGSRIDAGIFNDILEVSKSELVEDAGGLDNCKSNSNQEKADSCNLKNSKVSILGKYANNYYKGEPAIVQTEVGSGKIIQFGGTFTRENVRALLKHTGIYEKYRSQLDIPADVELVVREKDGEYIYILLNYSTKEQEVSLFRKFKVAETGEEIEGLVKMAAYEVLVMK